MIKNAAGYAFHEWTDERMAKFVGYRMEGLHTEWAVFWALVDREDSPSVYSEAEVEKHLARSLHPFELWTIPFRPGHDRLNLMPPKGLFDALEHTHDQ